MNGHFASVDIWSLLWSAGRRHHLRHPALGAGPPVHRSRLRQAVARPASGRPWPWWTTRTPMRGVFEQPGDVGESLDVSDAREVEIPAIGLRLAREGLLQVVAAPRSLQALSCPLESSLRRLGGERRGAAGTWRYGGGRRAARPRPFLRQAALRPQARPVKWWCSLRLQSKRV